MFRRLFISGLAVAPIAVLQAQPVTAKDTMQTRGEWTGESTLAEFSWSFTAQDSIGLSYWRLRHHDEGLRREMHTAEYRRKLHRWNGTDYQANLYAGLGAGFVNGSFSDNPQAVATGFFQADWETRRYYLMWQARAAHSNEFTHIFNTVQAGWAPWVAAYEDVAPWLILEATHGTEWDASVTVTPKLRLMWKRYWFEAGVSLDGDPSLNVRYTF